MERLLIYLQKLPSDSIQIRGKAGIGQIWHLTNATHTSWKTSQALQNPSGSFGLWDGAFRKSSKFSAENATESQHRSAEPYLVLQGNISDYHIFSLSGKVNPEYILQ